MVGHLTDAHKHVLRYTAHNLPPWGPSLAVEHGRGVFETQDAAFVVERTTNSILLLHQVSLKQGTVRSLCGLCLVLQAGKGPVFKTPPQLKVSLLGMHALHRSTCVLAHSAKQPKH